MKVKLFNKRLWMDFLKILSIVTAILSLVLTIIDFEQRKRLIISGIVLAGLLVAFLRRWYIANTKNEQTLEINSTKITIKYGDIFTQPGIKVIAFNEYFDTQVDDKIIASNSLNGICIKNHLGDISEIDSEIENEIRLRKNVVEEGVQRPYGGKTTKYRLGSICPIDDYFLLAFTHFDEENKAYISVEDYIACLMHMWNEIDRYYVGRPISITLLGSGITRFNDIKIQPQDLLKYIVMTFKASKVKYNNTSSLTIVLNEKLRNEINLYEIQED